jgi:mono/diheme cytochrome c family protein
MKNASTRRFVVIAFLTIACGLSIAVMSSGQEAPQAKKEAAAAKQGTRSQGAPPQAANQSVSGSAARGKYIVEEVALCINCHTPRDANGEIIRSQLLMGAPVFFQPAQRMPDWPQTCPRIGGTPPGTDDEMITLLTTGIWKYGQPLRQPMPRFHMTREDAQAVLEYLKSMKGTK